MIPWLETHSPFPDTRFALPEASGAAGLLAAGGDLSTGRLLEAYRQGIFPWFAEGQPILWWSPDPRMVLLTERFKISASLAKKLKQVGRSMDHLGPWQVRFDHAFEAVMRSCAAPRKNGPGTWISEDMIRAYSALHREGFAHSSELWHEGQLVAGVYGLCIGHMFYGESMFTHVSDGSKIALAFLVHFLRAAKVPLIDCQQETSHLASLGAFPVARDDFLTRVSLEIEKPPIAHWDASAIKADFLA